MAEALIKLPVPVMEGEISVEKAISRRRSVRRFGTVALSLWQIALILWSAQGITGECGQRVVPSAGAIYPLGVYAVVGEQGIGGLGAGQYS